jgi:hypothetical protein
MNVDQLNKLEIINPRPLPPWQREAFIDISIKPDQEIAREDTKTIGSRSNIIVYSDASRREGHLGASVVALNDN